MYLSMKLLGAVLHCCGRIVIGVSQSVFYVSVGVSEATGHTFLGVLRLVSCVVGCFCYAAEFITESAGNLEASNR
jgi:hypothetical protein